MGHLDDLLFPTIIGRDCNGAVHFVPAIGGRDRTWRYKRMVPRPAGNVTRLYRGRHIAICTPLPKFAASPGSPGAGIAIDKCIISDHSLAGMY